MGPRSGVARDPREPKPRPYLSPGNFSSCLCETCKAGFEPGGWVKDRAKKAGTPATPDPRRNSAKTSVRPRSHPLPPMRGPREDGRDPHPWVCLCPVTMWAQDHRRYTDNSLRSLGGHPAYPSLRAGPGSPCGPRVRVLVQAAGEKGHVALTSDKTER